ncbi:unnamed protein product [Choristocarpus tenellus]
MGATMRLGQRKTVLKGFNSVGNGVNGLRDCLTSWLYGKADEVHERHRHRYEVNPAKIKDIEDGGMEFVGRDETGERMEVAELPRSVHPFYVGTQYHPEFMSRPLEPSPPFLGLLLAACGQLDAWIESKK